MKRIKKIILVLLPLIIVFSLYSCSVMNTTKPGFLDDHLAELESYIPYGDSLNLEVSQVTVAWHLDHCLKTVNKIYDSLAASNPEQFKRSTNIPKIMSLTMNYIPRGRAQSPDVVRPPEIILTKDIEAQLIEAREKVGKALELDENAHFTHPVFGTIARGNALRFWEVHTEHHLKIIRDILQK